jgi:HEAT repeat protein
MKRIETAVAAAVALSRIRQDASTGRRMLIDMLRDRSPFMRARAASALGRLGPSAHDALAALKIRIDDSDQNVRRCTSRAISRIEGGSAQCSIKPLPMAPSGGTRFSFLVWPGRF